MKNLIKLTLTFLLLGGFVSCSTSNDTNDDSSSNNSSENVTQIENTAESGTWRITYYYDSDHEETNNFTGYNFTFNSDGSLIAENGNSTVTGTWSVTGSNSGSSSSDDNHFNIFFAAPPNFEKLSDDWEIVNSSSNKIELRDVSGGNGGTDYLTFTKN